MKVDEKGRTLEDVKRTELTWQGEAKGWLTRTVPLRFLEIIY